MEAEVTSVSVYAYIINLDKVCLQYSLVLELSNEMRITAHINELELRKYWKQDGLMLTFQRSKGKKKYIQF